MIGRQEIMEFARELGLAANIVEKDYVLGWLLCGISNHDVLKSKWIFKGGTCLKKCYFETYRFSEDLDFTIKESDHIDQEFLLSTFKEIASWVSEKTGIELPQENIHVDIYKNPRGNPSVQAKLSYKGPLQPSRQDLPRIKFDLTADEIIIQDPVIREAHHPYSDKPEGGILIQCYCYEELFAEKVRALIERLRPRDLYDVVHLFRHQEIEIDRLILMNTLGKKCSFKKVPIPTIELLEGKPERPELESEWANMLSHQLPELPAFELFWQELPAVFEWLYRAVEKKAAQPISSLNMPIDESWRPPAMAHIWRFTAPFELIRYAAANRLCVDLQYQGSHRLIEPYSVRRTKDENLLLFAVKHDTGGLRSYRVDRIQGAAISKIPFVPLHLIELTPSGPISAPHSRLPNSIMKRPKRSYARYGTKQKVECFYCGKIFLRKGYDLNLKPHKDKNGFPCPGRTGYIV